VRAYRGREPSAPMDAQSLVEVIDRLEQDGIDVWVDGGWGVDALLERETREHDDLDLVAELRHSDRIIALLEDLGFELVDGAPPVSFVLVDRRGRQVDVHPITFDAAGGGIYELRQGGQWVYPAEGFTGTGNVTGRPVRCLTPEVQVLVHAGYELTDKDFRELYLLRERFGVELPEHLAEPVARAGGLGDL
jgi:lincosamide nucleotidyltransferase A/C/D/E